MDTVFSHIIRKRFSQVNEDVATDALAYILESSESARNGMMKLLRGIVPDLPLLRFKTQQSENTIRPDMCGVADNQTRVFVENKFWAGLTDNQPVSYLKELAKDPPRSTVLLVIAPAAREQTLRRELERRLIVEKISTNMSAPAAAVSYSVSTGLGPVLALTSWGNVLSILEHECADDPRARGDLVQLRALCDSADVDAFAPVSRAEVTDQRTPAFIIQLSAIVQAAVDRAVTQRTVLVDGLRPQASWERIGRYVRVSGDGSAAGGAGAWFGLHFGLWKTHGTTPLWLIFDHGDWGRGREIQPIIEPWATMKGMLTVSSDHYIAVALEIPEGEEEDVVIHSLADVIKQVADVLQQLPPKLQMEVGQPAP